MLLIRNVLKQSPRKVIAKANEEVEVIHKYEKSSLVKLKGGKDTFTVMNDNLKESLFTIKK